MSISFTVGYTDDADVAQLVTFATLDVTNGRKALRFRYTSPEYSKQTFSLPGIDGLYLVRGGLRQTNIVTVTRYIAASISLAEGMYLADSLAFPKYPLTLTSPGGHVFERVEVMPQGMIRDERIFPTGRTAGQIYFDVTTNYEVLA